MSNLFDLIRNKITEKKLNDYAQNMPALQIPEDNTGTAAPVITGLQLSPDGASINEIDTQPMNMTPAHNAGLLTRARAGIKNFNLGDALLGKAANPTDNIGELEDDTISAGISSNPRVGGLFNDITAGARENYNSRFDANNLSNDIGSDGRKKGFAYRLGEGLGTTGRFLQSPLGRGLLMTGFAAGLNGSSPAEALAYGVSTAAKNQQLRSADNLYRQQLKDNYGMTDEQLNNVNGYISKDTFSNLATNAYRNQALQVRRDIAGAQDNTKRANLIMQGLNNGTITPDEAKLHMANYGITFDDLSKSNATRNADMNEQLLPYKQYALQMTPQVALGNLAVAQGNLGLRQALLPYQIEKLQAGMGGNLSKADAKTYNENMSTLADIDAGLKLIGENPSAYTFAKGIMGSDLANRIDPKGVKTRTQIDNITAVYRKWLTGAQMSDAERKAYERFLPAPTDNAQIVTAKLQGMRDSIERKNNILMQNAQSYQAQNDGGWAF